MQFLRPRRRRRKLRRKKLGKHSHIIRTFAKCASPLCKLSFDFAAESLAGKIVFVLPGFSDQFLKGRTHRIMRNNAIIRVRRRDRSHRRRGSAKSRFPETLRLSDGGRTIQWRREKQCGCATAHPQEIAPREPAFMPPWRNSHQRTRSRSAGSGSGARRGGRKNVAHGDSRGEKAESMRLKSPGRGDRAVLIVADLLSPLRGSACSLSAAIPRLGAVGHILAPLMRLGVGRRAYSSAYAPGERAALSWLFPTYDLRHATYGQRIQNLKSKIVTPC
ncbi:exported hypothetical protein [Acidobacteriia bacterium SbA2]|nr:exported hypothetical protein [Acidobacteriia bacterium SbA2]